MSTSALFGWSARQFCGSGEIASQTGTIRLLTNHMHALIAPVIGSFIWVGGGSAGLILLIVIIVLLVRR